MLIGNIDEKTYNNIWKKQNINASAKNRLRGTANFADVSAAVNIWIVTATMKTQLINAILEK